MAWGNKEAPTTLGSFINERCRGMLIYIDMIALRFVSVKVRQIISLIGL